MKRDGLEDRIRDKTGLALDPYFSATKIKWILDHVDGARAEAENGNLLLGTIDSWLIWNWTGGKVHATDVTNASRTLLFNIHTLSWDDELLKLFGLPAAMLPEVRMSDETYGEYPFSDGTNSIPICGVIGDSQGALFGQQCYRPGMVKATYGTGTSLLMHTGNESRPSANGLVSTVAWGIKGKVEYALEGIIHSSGDTVKWTQEQLHAFDHFDQAESMATELTDNEGVYLVPAFVGLGAPHWDPYAKAAIVGMSRDTRLSHIVRAAMESIAYQVKDVVELMEEHADIRMDTLRVDGGASGNQFLMQFQADILRAQVICSRTAELSAMGAVFLAGIGMGVWEGKFNLPAASHQTYEPRSAPDKVQLWYEGWKKAVARVLL